MVWFLLFCKYFISELKQLTRLCLFHIRKTFILTVRCTCNVLFHFKRRFSKNKQKNLIERVTCKETERSHQNRHGNIVREVRNSRMQICVFCIRCASLHLSRKSCLHVFQSCYFCQMLVPSGDWTQRHDAILVEEPPRDSAYSRRLVAEPPCSATKSTTKCTYHIHGAASLPVLVDTHRTGLPNVR